MSNSATAPTVGLDIGGTKVLGVLLDADGQVVGEERRLYCRGRLFRHHVLRRGRGGPADQRHEHQTNESRSVQTVKQR